LATYRLDDDQCELVSLNSLLEKHGIGSALVEAVREEAGAAGCRRLWLITTNDNLPAQAFYEKQGFALVQVHRHALTESRRLKPEIPLVGVNGLPIRDELEYEQRLSKDERGL
jgi:GNAT superfamily N-acetyltransferase